MVMVNDFPILSNPGPTLLFSDCEEFHVRIRRIWYRDAETKLIPYLNRISKWRRKLRIKFSAAKLVLINFSTQRRKQVVPLLFLFGTKIPEAKEAKHLGFHFDSGLRWKKPTEETTNKTIKLRNLFEILTKTKHGSKVDPPLQHVQGTSTSRIEYWIMSYMDVRGKPDKKD